MKKNDLSIIKANLEILIQMWVIFKISDLNINL
jgi:hypothetical protein